MGTNSSTCCPYNKRLLRKDRNKSDPAESLKIIALDKFFQCPINNLPTDITNQDDSINDIKAQVNSNNQCFVEITKPRGSFIVNDRELKQRLTREVEGKNFYTLNQLHSFGLSGFSMHSHNES